MASAFPGAANAAKYGSLGAGSPGVLDPKDAIIDDEILGSSVVQDALKAIKEYSKNQYCHQTEFHQVDSLCAVVYVYGHDRDQLGEGDYQSDALET